MDKIIDYLNQNSGALSVVFSCVSLLFSGIVAIATVVYANLTKRLVQETIRMREAQTEPEISIYIQPFYPSHLLSLTIRNIGLGPAHNLSFKADPDIEYFRERHISEHGLIKNGIKYIAPGQESHYYFGPILAKNEEYFNKNFSINVTYENNIGHVKSNTYHISFSDLKELLIEHSELDNINNTLDQIKNAIAGLFGREMGKFASGPKLSVVLVKNPNQKSIIKRICLFYKSIGKIQTEVSDCFF